MKIYNLSNDYAYRKGLKKVNANVDNTTARPQGLIPTDEVPQDTQVQTDPKAEEKKEKKQNRKVAKDSTGTL